MAHPIPLEQLARSYYQLVLDGFQPTRIDMSDYYIRVLMVLCGWEPDPERVFQHGEHVGKYMGVDVFMSEEEQAFTVSGARR